MALNGQELAKFAESKKGTPYVYGAKGADGKFTQSKLNWLAANYPKMFTSTYLRKIATKGLVGKVCTDCSGLISWYTGKVLGSSQMYSTAYARLPISQWQKFAVGTVVWKSGHVGVYLGNGLVAEAKGIDYGTVISKIGDVNWTYGLTFSYIDYTIDTPIASEDITYKGTNPYTEPKVTLRKGNRGNDVKWLQWELVEAGYSITIDGSFGMNTQTALKKFQQSAKIEVDGVCGPATRKALICDVADDNDTTSSSSTSTTKNPYTQPTKTLDKGDKGNDVKWLQWELNQSGANLNIDGDFGSATEKAVISFQDEKGLEVDGKVGPATRAALLAE